MSALRLDWSAWSEPQLRCLCQLYRVVPTHETVMVWRKVRSNTVHSLIFHGLAERIYLAEEARLHLRMPFLVLTETGEAVKRDYVLWMRECLDRVGSLPTAMQAIAELRI